MSTFTTELEAGARAMAEAREEYGLQGVAADPSTWFVWSGHPTRDKEIEHCRGTRVECQHWIDCQAFAAGLEAFASALPVEGAAGVTRGFIRHITGRDA